MGLSKEFGVNLEGTVKHVLRPGFEDESLCNKKVVPMAPSDELYAIPCLKCQALQAKMKSSSSTRRAS